jgi:hypothetical protein
MTGTSTPAGILLADAQTPEQFLMAVDAAQQEYDWTNPGKANPLQALDQQTVGMVNPTSPLYLMVSEGNHTIGVCADFVCEQEDVTIRFGRYVTVDFSERLHKDVVIIQPTARVLDCYKNGNQLSVDIEFINPSSKDLQMSVAVSCGYSYNDARTGIKMGDSTRGTLVQNVKAGQRITNALYLNLVNGNSLSYSYPVIEELKVK